MSETKKCTKCGQDVNKDSGGWYTGTGLSSLDYMCDSGGVHTA